MYIKSLNKTILLGVMQGRLLPAVGERIQAFPSEKWLEEFPLAQECGLDIIEWIFEGDNWKSNPIWFDPEAIVRASNSYGIRVVTLIADFFMDFTRVRATREEIK